MTDGQVLAASSFGREGDVLLAVVFLALLASGAVVAWLLDGDRRVRQMIDVARESRPVSSAPVLSGPYLPPLPPVSPPPVGGCGPDSVRLAADVLLVMRGFDPDEERAGVNGSGVADRADREAVAVMTALRDGHGRWMA